MSIMGTQPPAIPPAPPPLQQQPMIRRHRALRIGGCVGIGMISVGVIAGCSTHTVTTPGPTVTNTVEVPGPTATVTASPAPPPSGTALGTWSGTGNKNTPAFSAPLSGDYIVSWTYSNNTDPSIGGATNFSISATDPNAFGGSLPNDIATSGSGSTEITGVTPGDAESFNVQAAGQWTIKVVSAS
jgi:hypothetical protein